MGSPKYALSSTDFKRWGWLALAACIAAILDVVTMYVIPDLQRQGPSMTLITGALILIVDLVRRYVTDTRVVKVLLFAFILSLSSSVYAQLSMPSVVDEHTLIKATVPLTENSTVFWDVYSISNGNPFVDTESFDRDGKNNLLFTGAPGDYAVKVRVVSIQDGMLKKTLEDRGFLKIAKGKAPVVPPGPVDPVNPVNPVDPVVPPKPVDPVVPTPVVPDTVLGYSTLAFEQGSKIIDKSLIQEIANNFESVAAGISAGGIKSITIAFNQITNSNSKTLEKSKNKEEWRPFFSAIDLKLKADVKSGVLTKLDAVADAFMETSVGLKAVK
jgi:hypothetical protein